MKKFIKVLLVGTLAMALSSCGGSEETTEVNEQQEQQQDNENTEEADTTEAVDENNTLEEEINLVPGEYHAETSDFDSNGYISTVDVTVGEDGSISKVYFDAYNTEGTTKREAVEAGDYDMTVAGAQSSWTEQADALAKYIIDEQTTIIKLNEEGKTDSVSGVSISVAEYLNLVDEALMQEQALEKEDNVSSLNAGSYTVESSSFDSNGYKDVITLTVDENGLFSDVFIDAFTEDGQSKREAVEAGDYDMSVAGAQSSWTEQVDAFAKYVVENQNYGVPVHEEGKTDAISGVSIEIISYVRLLDDAITLAE